MEPLPSIDHLAPNLRRLGIELPHSAKVGAFGDSAEQSRQLLSLIRSGRKRGGASLLWAYEAEGEPVPEVGDVEVVVDYSHRPSLVTRITEVEIVPFNTVGPGFAAREGEGDGSLEYWRSEHWRFFTRECRRIGREPLESMPVVCCSFEVLHVVPESEAG
jgi:uncharacterized protein YhfF